MINVRPIVFCDQCNFWIIRQITFSISRNLRLYDRLHFRLIKFFDWCWICFRFLFDCFWLVDSWNALTRGTHCFAGASFVFAFEGSRCMGAWHALRFFQHSAAPQLCPPLRYINAESTSPRQRAATFTPRRPGCNFCAPSARVGACCFKRHWRGILHGAANHRLPFRRAVRGWVLKQGAKSNEMPFLSQGPSNALDQI